MRRGRCVVCQYEMNYFTDPHFTYIFLRYWFPEGEQMISPVTLHGPASHATRRRADTSQRIQQCKRASILAGDTCASSHTALLRLDEVLTPRSSHVQQSHFTSAGALHDSQEVISCRLDLSHSPQGSTASDSYWRGSSDGVLNVLGASMLNS